MKEEVKILFLLLVAFAVSRSFVIIKDNYIEPDVIAAEYNIPLDTVNRMIEDGIVSPYLTHGYFIASEVKLTPQTHAYFVCLYFTFIVLFFCLYKLSHKLRSEFFLLFLFQIAFFIDYFISYGDPWFWILSIPIGMDFIYGVALAMVILQTFKYKWEM